MTALGCWLRRLLAPPPISSAYRIITDRDAPRLRLGWTAPAIVARQQQAFEPLLSELRHGRPRSDFVALADAVRASGLMAPSVIEVGCATGWNSEVLRRLLAAQLDYVGVDYSSSMIAAAAASYPGTRFAVGDATALPFADEACDVVISGTVLMHVADYRTAIHESSRVARRAVVFHTVPVLQRRATTMLSKHAYGESVVEVIFNEGELMDCFRAAGLQPAYTCDSVSYDLESVLGERTLSRTYLCQKSAS